MKIRFGGRLFLVAAVVGVAAVFAIGLLIALGGRSVVAGPEPAPPAAAPTPVGHEWSQVEGHGTDAAGWWLGTTGSALELRVGSSRVLRLEPGLRYGGYNVIGGSSANSVTAGVSGATIGGGGGIMAPLPLENRVTDDWGTVGGGMANTAGDNAGGTNERAFATVGGGLANTASGYAATVGGGNLNSASGGYATVPGGAGNSAAGDYSFAAGNGAQANNAGCFVWADSTSFPYVACNNDNRFIARASGGVYLYTNSALSTGAYLAAGSGTWTDLSDRNLKDNFTPVDGQAVLASLADIPIATWNYKAQDAAIRHMGPVAQDFYAAFGLGESETGISTVDADGVALAAIQGLYQLAQEQAARIQALEADNASLQQRLDDLEARVTALEQGGGTNGASAGPLSSGLTPAWLLLGGLGLVGLVVVQRRRAGGRP